MNVIKFIGKALALPIKIVMFIIELGLLPIKLLINWLSGYGRYNRLYLTFFKIAIKNVIEAVKRGEKPGLENIIKYVDDYKIITFYNYKNNPLIRIDNRITTDENGYNPVIEIIE